MKSSALAIEPSTYSAPRTSLRIGMPLSNSVWSDMVQALSLSDEPRYASHDCQSICRLTEGGPRPNNRPHETGWQRRLGRQEPGCAHCGDWTAMARAWLGRCSPAGPSACPGEVDSVRRQGHAPTVESTALP